MVIGKNERETTPPHWNSSKCSKLSVAVLAQAIWVTNRASGARGTMWLVRRLRGAHAKDRPKVDASVFSYLLVDETRGAADNNAPDPLPECYPKDATVQFQYLCKKPQYNGFRGTIQDFNPETHEYDVMIRVRHKDKLVRVRHTNIKLVEKDNS